MKQVNDLHITNFDVLSAKGDRVCLRYTAEGHHKGAPHGDIPPSGKKAQWTASTLFRVEDGKLAARRMSDSNKTINILISILWLFPDLS